MEKLLLSINQVDQASVTYKPETYNGPSLTTCTTSKGNYTAHTVVLVCIKLFNSHTILPYEINKDFAHYVNTQHAIILNCPGPYLGMPEGGFTKTPSISSNVRLALWSNV